MFSCDTFVVRSTATEDKSTLFCKNSDRPPNEPQEIAFVPRASHDEGDFVQCTYTKIPQVSITYACILSKPSWMFGAEMGANEFNVVVGNEAVFTKNDKDSLSGRSAMSSLETLLGMDLLRLGLERSKTALECVHVITSLLSKYGQDGNAHMPWKGNSFFYSNSYLIVDPHQIWILETAGKHWVAKQVTSGKVASISNSLSIGSKFDLHSDGIVEFAVKHGLCKNASDFNFARDFGNFLEPWACQAWWRQCRTEHMFDSIPKVNIRHMFSGSRDHATMGNRILQNFSFGSHVKDALKFSGILPAQKGCPGDMTSGIFSRSICTHGGYCFPGIPIKGDNTNGTLISHIPAPVNGTIPLATHFVTGTSTPCTSIFKPIWIDACPDFGPRPGPTPTFIATHPTNSLIISSSHLSSSSSPVTLQNFAEIPSLWWRHECFQRNIMADYAHRQSLFEKERDLLENDFIECALKFAKERPINNYSEIINASSKERLEFATSCLKKSCAKLSEWSEKISRTPIVGRGTPFYYNQFYRNINKQVNMYVEYKSFGFLTCVLCGIIMLAAILFLLLQFK